jgi:SNF2 family DNA or RNA helicase
MLSSFSQISLGKTLQFLSLVLNDRDCDPVPDTAKTSLVVCPLSIINNWVCQIEEHVKEDANFTVYVTFFNFRYVAHGPNRNMKKSHLESFDLVITTYNVLAQYAGKKPPKVIRMF